MEIISVKYLDFTEIITMNKYAHKEKRKEIKCLFNEDKDWDKNIKKKRMVV